MACFVYEAMVLFGILLIPGAVGALGVAVIGERQAIENVAILQVFTFVLMGVYFIGFWVRRGQTLPMQTWHIRLETSEGERVGWGRALARFLASCVWIVPPALLATLLEVDLTRTLMLIVAWILAYAMLALLHPRRQFWHDALCGTRLVTHRPPARA